MGTKSYNDELMRALARPDIDTVREKVELYYRFIMASGKEQEALLDDRQKEFDPYFFANDDPDLSLSIIVLAASMYDDIHFLGAIAAGPLEEILSKPSAETLQRVIAEARKNARFRWLLKGLFLHAVAAEARPKIAAAISNISENDPLPPR